MKFKISGLDIDSDKVVSQIIINVYYENENYGEQDNYEEDQEENFTNENENQIKLKSAFGTNY